jgi:hypothetical protein
MMHHGSRAIANTQLLENINNRAHHTLIMDLLVISDEKRLIAKRGHEKRKKEKKLSNLGNA